MKSFTARLFAHVATAVLIFTTSVRAQSTATLTTLHTFGTLDGNNENSDGTNPTAALIEGSDGNFYGDTYNGGPYGGGTLFEIAPTGAFTTLHGFGVVPDGVNPSGALIQDSNGNFYGTTRNGGTNGVGILFELSPGGTLTTLHSFLGDDHLGSNPYAGLTQGIDGNFYGTTFNGGAGGVTSEKDGTVFEITPGGELTTLYSFSGPDGAGPSATLLQGSDGDFYGITYNGGTDGDGTIFRVTSAGTFTTLFNFAGGNDANGNHPYSGLIQGKDGNFYGTTQDGGAIGGGTFFQVTPTGMLTTLYTFGSDAGSGTGPQGGVIQGSDGNFYGIARYGGANGNGTVFQLTPTGTMTTLYGFSALTNDQYNNDGAHPQVGLIQGRDGAFYGATWRGGTGANGTIFKLTVSPTITSTGSSSATVGQPFSYQITATNGATSFGADGLPDGLSLDASSGLISGIPTAVGTASIGLSATNVGGTGTANLLISTGAATPNPAPIITSATVTSAQINLPFTYQITVTNTPGSYAASGLPAGLSVDVTSGLISGTPTDVGVFSITLTATNAGGVGNATLTLTLVAPTVNVAAGGSATAIQGQTNGVVLVTRTGDTSLPLTVLYKAKGAVAGVVYRKLPGTVVIPAGAAKAKVKIKFVTDAVIDGTPKLKVTVLPAADGHYVVGAIGMVKIKLIGQ